jgi:hypothetical protein
MITGNNSTITGNHSIITGNNSMITPVTLTKLWTHLHHTHTLARDALSHAEVSQLKSKHSMLVI